MREHSRRGIIPFPNSLARHRGCSQNRERDRFGSRSRSAGYTELPFGRGILLIAAEEALRDRLLAGVLARAYRSQARDGMRLLWRAPMRIEEQGWSRIKAMERISEPIIGGKRDGEILDDPE